MKYILCICLLLPTLYAKDLNEIHRSMGALVDTAISAQNEKEHVITLVSKNKTLSQKMAKNAILIALGVETDKNNEELMGNAKAFDATIKALRNGDATLKVTAVQDPLTLKHLGEVENTWKPFYEQIAHFMQNGEVNPNALRHILDENEKLLRLSHKLTQTLKSLKQIDTAPDKVTEHALEIADRQRMLTQKMLKEQLLIFGEVDAERNKIRLQGSRTLLEHGLKGLLEGDVKRGLIKVSDPKIHQKLVEIGQVWSKVRAIYANDTKITEDNMITLLTYDPILLQKCDELVISIEQSLGL